MVSEAMLCIKNARELFERTQAVNIILWLLIQLIISVIFVYGCILYHRYTQVIVKFWLKAKNKVFALFLPLNNDNITTFALNKSSCQEEPNEDEEVLVNSETQEGKTTELTEWNTKF